MTRSIFPRLMCQKTCKREFSNFSAIFDTRAYEYEFDAKIWQNSSNWDFLQLDHVFLRRVHPFSLTKRANVNIFEHLTINRRYRTCCISSRHPFWILFQQRVKSGHGTTALSLCLFDRIKIFWKNISGRPEKSPQIGQKWIVNYR